MRRSLIQPKKMQPRLQSNQRPEGSAVAFTVRNIETHILQSYTEKSEPIVNPENVTIMTLGKTTEGDKSSKKQSPMRAHGSFRASDQHSAAIESIISQAFLIVKQK